MLGEELSRKLDELEQWFKENPKLPLEIDRILLRRFLKCMYNDMEETKKLVELNFSMRNKNPHIFLDRDPENEKSRRIRDATEMLPLPGLTPDGHKLLFFRLADTDPNKLNSIEECKAFFMLADCRFAKLDLATTPNRAEREHAEVVGETLTELDTAISNGEVQICDIAGYTLSHMTRISFVTFRMYMKFLLEAYPVRLRAMHVINCPTFLNKMIAFVRPFIPDDVYKMIHFHTEGIESLYEHVPREMLPNEYGGRAGTITELKRYWTEELQLKRNYLMDPKQWKAEPAQSSRRWYWF